MNRLAIIAAATAAVAFSASTALAEPSSSSAAGVADVVTLNALNAYSGNLLSASIKTSEQKDVVAAVSLECGAYTRTKVKGQKGETDSATAQSKVQVAVIIDKGTDAERMAAPGWVTFCEREQTLNATLGGVLESCDVTLVDTDGDGIPDSASFTKDDCTFSDEEIELILRTMGAHHFNFILTNLGASGVAGHTVDVEAQVTTNGAGDYTANATIGKGTVTVDEVRFVKDFEAEAF